MKNEWKKLAKDFLDISDQFKLGNLPTEKPHPETRELSVMAHEDLDLAISTLKNIDIDCLQTLIDKFDLLGPLKEEIHNTLREGNFVFICGCGATGRLALTLERIYREDFDGDSHVISFMAGGDVALISSIEKFEDFESWGGDQLMDLGFTENDLLIGSSEGGETPWVIGAVEKAAKVSTRKPWFLYCNPDDILKKLVERSRRILVNNRINKINLFCGEMALAGSTRMQASTILTLGIGLPLLNHDKDFLGLKKIYTQFVNEFKKLDLSRFKEFIQEESSTYLRGEFCQYQCDSHLGISILTDTTERSPTFSLPPFENVNEDVSDPSLCYFSYSHISKKKDAWNFLLGREPRTVEWDDVREKTSAKRLDGYNISSGSTVSRNKYLTKSESVFEIVLEDDQLIFKFNNLKSIIKLSFNNNLFAHVLLKMILNIQSTLVMGKLNRYENNIMTWVKSSNNKLIDRTARNCTILLAGHGMTFSYEEIIHKIFEEKEQLKSGEALVLKVVHSLLDSSK